MAIEIKASEGYGYSVAALFLGKSSPLLASAKAVGVQIKHPSGDVYQVFYNGAHYGSITIKPQALTLAKEGAMGKMSKDAIKYQFKEALNKAIASLDQGSNLASQHEDTGIDVKEGSDELKLYSLQELMAQKEAQAQAAEAVGETSGYSSGMSSANWGEPLYCLNPDPHADVTNLKKESPMTDDVCKLIDATELYQKVSATSMGSVYQVIMILLGANIAARVKGNKLSLRAEGQHLSQYQESLVGFGFSGPSVSDYLSLHVNVPDEEIRKQVIGALAGRIGFSWVMKVGDICKVTGV